jgi:hypothetical protein
MLRDNQSREHHEKFRELSALAGTGSLTAQESVELRAHLEHCEECREIARQYRVLAIEGMSVLAAGYGERLGQADWDDRKTRENLFARVRADQQEVFAESTGRTQRMAVRVPIDLLRRVSVNRFVQTLIAASLIIALGLGGYRLGRRAELRAARASLPDSSSDDRFRKLAAEKGTLEEMLAGQGKKLGQVQEESARKEQELARLRAELRALGDHSNELVEANSQSAGKLQDVSLQRDALNAQLQTASQSYQSVSAELTSLWAEREKSVLRIASLEAQIAQLSAANRDQERRLKDAEQYLVSDRDIRELMGARKLYIADVFDVDGGSQTRKPFGRVFYTQGKSLIFYAFDLDRRPGVVNANTFQVWGQRDTAQGEQPLPMNLGILYMDNESNRRWVMRFDDPKQLAEIDAVFVTVEPRGGSQKPTSKPFLYALLRNEVNHP